ncbi:MAG: hypothetical protein H6712_05420 [Myxococcales bacterium]|nr:hypothetical protein [Myxococcales bacterium]MCB9713273.1 hypothetical protein [Myxococcales bacterium]
MRGGTIGLGLWGALAVACAGGEGQESSAGVTGAASDGTASGSGSAGTSGGSEPATGGETGSSSEGLDETYGCPLETYYPDVDEDGYGDVAYPVEACLQPPAHIPQGGDCDDANPDVHPGVDEVCDGADNDCNGLVDEASPTNATCQGCSLGLRDGHAYYYCPAAPSWDEARAACMLFAADLVKLDDQAEQDFLLAEPLPAVPVLYLGLNDLEVEGSFVWTDGSAPAFTAWGAGEPNDALEGEDCAQLAVPAGTWNDIACATAAAFICEAPPPA